MVTTVSADNVAKQTRTGNRLYEADDFAGALEKYKQALKINPESGIINFNVGSAYYKAGEYESAVEHLQRSVLTDDDQLRQRAHYNLGNARYQYGRGFVQKDKPKAIEQYEQAIREYDKVIVARPDDEDALHNRKIVQDELDRLKQEQASQPNQQSQQSQDDQNKDSQSDNQDQNNDQSNQSDQNDDSSQQDQSDDSNQDENQEDQSDSENQPDDSQDQPDDSQDQPQNQDQSDESEDDSQSDHSSTDDQEEQNNSDESQSDQQNNQQDQSDNSQGQDSPQDQSSDSQQDQEQDGQGDREQPQDGQENQPSDQNDNQQPPDSQGDGRSGMSPQPVDISDLTAGEAEMMLRNYQQSIEPTELLNFNPPSRGVPVLKDW